MAEMFWNASPHRGARNGVAGATASRLRNLLVAGAAAGLLALSGPITVQANPVAVIRNDPGGSLEARLEMIAQYRASGTRVEIRGRCDSACTLLLGLATTCVARSSRFGFHGPQSQYYGVGLTPDAFEYWSMIMADHYPGKMRSWFLNEARQTTLGLVTITGAQAIGMGARPCAG